MLTTKAASAALFVPRSLTDDDRSVHFLWPHILSGDISCGHMWVVTQIFLFACLNRHLELLEVKSSYHPVAGGRSSKCMQNVLRYTIAETLSHRDMPDRSVMTVIYFRSKFV